MAATLGSLVVSLAVDTARFQGDLGRAASIAESRMRNIKDTAQRALGAVAVAAAAAGAALAASLRSGIDRADEINDLSQALGLTTEQLTRLQFAAKQGGVEIETLNVGMRHFADIVTKAAGGNKEAVSFFSQLGISVKDANGALRPTGDILNDLADLFQRTEDGAAKTAIALEAFGSRSGSALIPTLNEGAAGLKEMAEQSDRLGFTITQNTARAADAFNDKLGVLSAATTGFKTQLAAQLLPTLNNLIEPFTNVNTAGNAMERMVTIAAAGVRALITTLLSLGEVLSFAGKNLGAFVAAIVQVTQGNFGQAFDIMRSRIIDGIEDWKAFGKTVSGVWDTTGNEVEQKAPEVAKKLAAPIIEAVDTASKYVDGYAELAQRILEQQAQIDNSVVRTLNNQMLQAHQATERALAKQRATMWSDWAEAGKEAVRGIQRATVDWLMNLDDTKNSLKGLIDLLRRIALETAVSGLFKPKSQGGAGWGDAVSSFIGGFFGASAPSSSTSNWSGPRYGAGTRYVPEDQLAMVHRGEAIVPAKFNSGWMGGVVFAPVYHIDARGATPDAIKLLPEIMKRNNDALEARIVGRLRSGRYG